MNAMQPPESFGLARLDAEPENVHEAIDRIARIKAVQGWLADADRITRSWISNKAEEIEAITGAAFRAPVANVGQAYVTDPQPSVVIVDPYGVGATPSDGVKDVKETTVDEDALIAFMVTYDTGDVELAASALRKANATKTRRYLPDDYVERKLAGGAWAIDGDRVVDTTTGEIVAGATVKPAGKRTLTVRVDGDYLKRLSRQFMQQLGRGDDNA